MQLVYNAPSLRRYISEAAKEQIDIANHSLRDQWRQLVIRPLLRLDKRLSPSSYLLIIDALDECNNEDHIRTILQLLAEARGIKCVTSHGDAVEKGNSAIELRRHTNNLTFNKELEPEYEDPIYFLSYAHKTP